MHATLPTLHILTAPGRESTLARTLASLRASDWPMDPIIHMDRGGADVEPRIRTTAAWREMLDEALGGATLGSARDPMPVSRGGIPSAAPWRVSSDEGREVAESAPAATTLDPRIKCLFIVRDDVTFHPNIAARLVEWPPFARSCIRTFASLFHSASSHDFAGNRGPSWYAAQPGDWSGAEALLVAPAFAAHCIAHWTEFPGTTHDRRIAALAKRDYPTSPVWVHVPSLVEKTEPFSMRRALSQTAKISFAS